MKRCVEMVIIFNIIGIYYYADGNRYDGEWSNNEKKGRGNLNLLVGILYYIDGGRYEGEWKNNKKFGKGNSF